MASTIDYYQKVNEKAIKISKEISLSCLGVISDKNIQFQLNGDDE